MKSKKEHYLGYIKAVALAVLAVILFYFGMKDYVSGDSSDIAVTELYGNFPTVSQAEQIWENCQRGDEITDVCFLWNGGIQEAKNPQYSRQANVRVTGVMGMAELYCMEGTTLAQNDENGCVIDRSTALELFGSENCVGSQLTVGERPYEVRGVAPWKWRMVLIRPLEKDLLCTQVLIRSKTGQNLDEAASNFFMGNGLSGTLVDDSWLDVILPWFPVIFLLMLAISGSKWAFSREREARKILLWGACFFFSVRLLSDIPTGWLPDRWSDFSFWPAKIQKTMEAFRWYIMFPKTMAQAERLINGISCMIKCGAAALLIRAV